MFIVRHHWEKKSDTQNRLKKQQRLIQCIKVINCQDTMMCKLVQSKRLRTDATDDTHHTNTDDTCGSRTLHDVHARLTRRFCFGPVRGCKHTRWVQAFSHGSRYCYSPDWRLTGWLLWLCWRLLTLLLTHSRVT